MPAPPPEGHSPFPAPLQEELNRRNLHARRLYMVLREINKTIVQHSDQLELQRDVCKVLVQSGGFRMAWIGAPDAEGWIFPHAVYGDDLGYLASVRISDRDIPCGRGPTGTAIRTGEYVLCNHIADNPLMHPWKEAAARNGFASSACFPFKLSDGRTAGLTLYSAEHDFFTDDEVELIMEVVEDIGYALTALQSIGEKKMAERWFHEVFDSISDMIFIHEIPSGKIIAVNQSMCSCYGYTPEEATNLSLSSISSGAEPYTADNALSLMKAAAGDPQIFEWHCKRRDGSLFWGEITMRKATLGKEERLLVVVRDVTDRKEAAQALRESMERYKMLFNSMSQGMAVHQIICDDEGEPVDYIFLDVNPAFESILGRKRDDIVGRSIRDIIPTIEEYWIDTLCRVAITGIPVQYENYVAGLDRHYQVYAYSPRKGQFAVLASDITEMKRAEEERQRLEQQVMHAQKLESLGVLAGGIAHDFNNILMSVIGNANLALMRISPESPAVDNLRRIEVAAGRAADLSKQMLAYSGKGRFVIESIDFNRLIEEMTHMLEVSISKKALLRYNLAQPLPPVEGDPTQLRQVVMNLVINASEAIGDQSGVITITTGCIECDRVYLSENWLEEQIPEGLYFSMEVTDNGCGMDKETTERIFDPFFTTKFTGRGLGMAAVLGIVRGHRGAIRVYSEIGKGTTFRIILPVSNRPSKSLHGSDNASTEWRGHGKVLLVDDEQAVCDIGAEMLQEMGYEVVTAPDGRAALERFREVEGIRLVVLDLTMPHLDGEQTFRELRKLKSDVRVIMSSGYNEQEVTQKFVGKGLAGFVQKPYTFAALRDVVRGIEERPCTAGS